MLKIADNATLRKFTNRQNISNRQLRLLAAVNELTSVHALSSNEKLLLQPMLVGVAKLNDSKGSTTARIVNDLLDYAFDVSVTLCEVKRAQLRGSLSVLGVRLENRATTPTTSTNNTTLHTSKVSVIQSKLCVLR